MMHVYIKALKLLQNKDVGSCCEIRMSSISIVETSVIGRSLSSLGSIMLR